jgi:hypothetical protein
VPSQPTAAFVWSIWSGGPSRGGALPAALAPKATATAREDHDEPLHVPSLQPCFQDLVGGAG